MGWLYGGCTLSGVLLIIVLLLPITLPAKVLLPEPVPEIGQSAVELGDFSGDGYTLSNMTAEYGTCWDKKDVCIRLAYTLHCEKKYCVIDNDGIRDDAIKVNAERHNDNVWPFGWFNRHESADNYELKRGESHTEMVVFKFDKPELGGVTITVDGQTIYQD